MWAMNLKRWPRKNDEESIRARQKALGLNDGVTGIDLSPFVNAQEMLTGAAVIPVSVVGPLEIELGEYELEEPFGRVTEIGRAMESRDAERLKEDLEIGVRLAESLGLDVSDVEMPF